MDSVLKGFNQDFIGFIVAQGEGEVVDFQGDGVLQRGPVQDSDFNPRQQAHIPDAPAEFPGGFEADDSGLLSYGKLTQGDWLFCHV